MKTNKIESIVISKDNYYENGDKVIVETSIVINRIGEGPENICFKSMEEIEMFQKILQEYIQENKPIN